LERTSLLTQIAPFCAFAARAGLEHVSSTPFAAGDYRGYICKRNKNGESFKNLHTLTHHGHDMWSATHRFAFPRENTAAGGSSAVLTDVIIPANSKARPRQEIAKPHQVDRFGVSAAVFPLCCGLRNEIASGVSIATIGAPCCLYSPPVPALPEAVQV
jgi:hypothetical protein